jgi:hypothetical protein
MSGYNYLYFDVSGNTSDLSEVYVHSVDSGRIDNSSYAGKGTTSPISISGINGEYYISFVAWNGRSHEYNNVRLVK